MWGQSFQINNLSSQQRQPSKKKLGKKISTQSNPNPKSKTPHLHYPEAIKSRQQRRNDLAKPVNIPSNTWKNQPDPDDGKATGPSRKRVGPSASCGSLRRRQAPPDRRRRRRRIRGRRMMRSEERGG